MIVEQRDYHVYSGKLPEVLRLYEEEGIPIQQEILGGLVGVFTTDIGALSTYSTLWRYESFAEREEKRARLQADPRSVAREAVRDRAPDPLSGTRDDRDFAVERAHWAAILIVRQRLQQVVASSSGQWQQRL